MKLPLEYRWLKANGFKGFTPWYLTEDAFTKELKLEYKKETGEDFYPFARRQDRDEVAGFIIHNGEIQNAVISVHLTWAGKQVKGFPNKRLFKDLFEWIKNEVIPDTREWMSEDDLQDILNEKEKK